MYTKASIAMRFLQRNTHIRSIQIKTQAYRTCQTTTQVHSYNLGFGVDAIFIVRQLQEKYSATLLCLCRPWEGLRSCAKEGPMVALLPDAVWPGESSGNSCLSKPPDTSHPGYVARCTRPAFVQLCSMVAKLGDQRDPPELWLRQNDHVIIHWICGNKDRDETPSTSLQQKLDIKDITLVLRCQQLRWYGHGQQATSSTKSITNFQIFGTRKKGRPRKTWSGCVKTDVNECGLPGIDPLDRDAWRAGV